MFFCLIQKMYTVCCRYFTFTNGVLFASKGLSVTYAFLTHLYCQYFTILICHTHHYPKNLNISNTHNIILISHRFEKLVLAFPYITHITNTISDFPKSTKYDLHVVVWSTCSSWQWNKNWAKLSKVCVSLKGFIKILNMWAKG